MNLLSLKSQEFRKKINNQIDTPKKLRCNPNMSHWLESFAKHPFCGFHFGDSFLGAHGENSALSHIFR